MDNPLQHALLFLTSTVLDFAALLLAVRFLLQWAKVSFYNPISQWLAKLTEPLLRLTKNWLPNTPRFSASTLAWLIFFIILKICATVIISGAPLPSILGILVWGLAELMQWGVQIFFFAILLQAILSWFMPLRNHPLSEILYQLTEPLLGVFRRILPKPGGIDLSPIPALIALQLVEILITRPLMHYGQIMTFAPALAG